MNTKKKVARASAPEAHTALDAAIKNAANKIVFVENALIEFHSSQMGLIDGLRDRVIALEGEIHALKSAHEQMNRVIVQNVDMHRREIRAVVLQSAKVELGPIRAIMLDLRADIELLAKEIKVVEGQDLQS